MRRLGLLLVGEFMGVCVGVRTGRGGLRRRHRISPKSPFRTYIQANFSNALYFHRTATHQSAPRNTDSALGTGSTSLAYVFTLTLAAYLTLNKLYTTSNLLSLSGKSTAVISMTLLNCVVEWSRRKVSTGRMAEGAT